MIRYYKPALAFFGIALLCFLSVALSSKISEKSRKSVEFTLTLIGGINTLISISLALRAYNQSKTHQDGKSEVDVDVHLTNISHDQVEFLSPEKSRDQYLTNLESQLCELGFQPSRFITLSSEKAVQPSDVDIEILQNFEWARMDEKLGTRFINRQPIELLQAHVDFPRYVLLGEPGSGKTTCLLYLALKCIADYRQQPSGALPLYVPLANWHDRRMSALDFLKSSFDRIAGPNNILTKEFESMLLNGAFLVILDGLNEMPGRRYYHHETGDSLGLQRVDLLRELSTGSAFRTGQDPRERSLRELATLPAARSRFIVSCRTHEFYGSLKWQDVYILPMNPSQIDAFIAKYAPAGTREKVLNLLKENESLKALATNPFFLRSLVSVYSPEFEAVKTKGEFLEYLCKELLKRERSRGTEFNELAVIKSASLLAFQMMKRGQIGSNAKLSLLSKRDKSAIEVLQGTGLITSRADGCVSFYHQLIQEFFCAVALREKFVHRSIKSLLCHEKWSETIVLLQNIGVKERVVASLFRALRMRNMPWRRPRSGSPKLLIFDGIILNTYSFTAALLSLEFLFGNHFLLPILIAHPAYALFIIIMLPFTIHQICLVASFHRTGISNAAYVLGRLRMPVAIEHLIAAYGRVGISRNKLSQALSSFGSVALPSLIRGLSSKKPLTRIGCIEAIGLSRSIEGVEPLISILRSGDTRYFQHVVTALARTGGEKSAASIAESIHNVKQTFNFRSAILFPTWASSFKSFKEFNPLVLEHLSRALAESQKPQIRQIIVQAIALYGFPEGMPILVQVATNRDEDLSLRQSSTSLLSLIRAPKQVDELMMIYQRCEELRPAVYEGLSKVSMRESRDGIIALLEHDDWRIRRACFTSLCFIGDPSIIERLVLLKDDRDEDVRAALATALGCIGGEDASKTLRWLVRDQNEKVRLQALDSLDLFFPDVARQIFSELARDRQYKSRVKVVTLLGYYHFSDVKEVLSELTADPDDEIRLAALAALKQLDRKFAMEARFFPTVGKRRLFSKFYGFLLRKSRIPEFTRMLHEEKAAGLSAQDAFNKVIQKIITDAELKRTFRLWFILIGLVLLFLFYILPGFLLGSVIELLALGTIFVRNHIVWSIITVAASLILRIKPVAEAIRRYRLSSITGALVRQAGLALLGFLLVALVIKYWWLVLTLAVVAIGLLAVLWKRKRKRGSGGAASANNDAKRHSLI